MNVASLTINVRILVNGKPSVPMWRVRILGLVAAILGIPLLLETDASH